VSGIITRTIKQGDKSIVLLKQLSKACIKHSWHVYDFTLSSISL